MSIESMKLALEALEWHLPLIEDYGNKEQLNRQHKAITALRQAIEQAEQAKATNKVYATREQLAELYPPQRQQEPVGYVAQLIEALYENGDPVSVDAAEFLEQAQKQERNFCPRCGKRLGKNDWDIHTCTPPAEQAQKQPDLDAICQDLQEKTYAQAMRIAELEQAQKEKQHGAD